MRRLHLDCRRAFEALFPGSLSPRPLRHPARANAPRYVDIGWSLVSVMQLDPIIDFAFQNSAINGRTSDLEHTLRSGAGAGKCHVANWPEAPELIP